MQPLLSRVEVAWSEAVRACQRSVVLCANSHRLVADATDLGAIVRVARTEKRMVRSSGERDEDAALFQLLATEGNETWSPELIEPVRSGWATQSVLDG